MDKYREGQDYQMQADWIISSQLMHALTAQLHKADGESHSVCMMSRVLAPAQ